MSIYSTQQEFNDLTWFHANAITLIAGMPTTVRGAGKFSLVVNNPTILEQAIAEPANIEQVRSILLTSFGDIVANVTIANKNQIMAMREQIREQLLQDIQPKFNALGLQVTKSTLEALQAI